MAKKRMNLRKRSKGENLMWQDIVGVSKTVEIITDESMVWNEDPEMGALHLVSTSSLIKESVSLAGELISTFLSEDLTSVATDVSFKHLKPVSAGVSISIGVRVNEVVENRIKLKVLIFKDSLKVAEGEIIRAVVSKNYLRRKAFEN